MGGVIGPDWKGICCEMLPKDWFLETIGCWYFISMGGLGCRAGTPGLPYGKLGFSSKGRVVSAEKASRRASICFCMSGCGHAFVQASRMRIWRVKYSLASLLNSGSGDVMATFGSVRPIEIHQVDYLTKWIIVHVKTA